MRNADEMLMLCIDLHAKIERKFTAYFVNKMRTIGVLVEKARKHIAM